jgi:hypothetical protein
VELSPTGSLQDVGAMALIGLYTNDVSVVHVEGMFKCINGELKQIVDVLSMWKEGGGIVFAVR